MEKIINTNSQFNKKSTAEYKYLTILSMLYLTCELASLVLSYKIVHIKFFFGAASSFIFPITYTWNDVITEVYGFTTTKKTIWMVFICDYFFVAMIYFLIKIPTSNPQVQHSYTQVLGPLWRSLSGEMLGVLAGAFINSVIISRWKILAKGKIFWIRSIFSTLSGECVMLFISVPIALYGVLTTTEMLSLIGYAYSYKVIFAIVISFPANLIANFIKRKEGIDTYDYNVSYNPFRRPY
ncbi:MAG: queuosine precursor transporter [Coxiellaceae bacterium]|nr:queuosine precursor transporter [Coxiellaceae bacterium]